jgi:hypothetical protein
LAKECQKSVVNQGNTLILNRRVVPLKGYYLVMLQNSEQSSRLFKTAMVAEKLGRFLIDAMNVRVKRDCNVRKQDIKQKCR